MTHEHSRRCRCLTTAEQEKLEQQHEERTHGRYLHPWDLVHVLSACSEVDSVFEQALELVSGVDRYGSRTLRFQACR